MVVDEDSKYVLTNYRQVKKDGKATNSDHATEYMDVNLKILTEKPKRKLMWNFKNASAQDKFKNLTSETNDFTDCFKEKLPVLEQIDKWWTVFNSNVRKAFKRIRITKKTRLKAFPNDISALINQRNKLNRNNDNLFELQKIEEEISNIEDKL